MLPQTFIVEKTTTGFSAYAEDFDRFPVGTTGKNVSELKQNIIEAINLFQEHVGAEFFTPDMIVLKYDLPQFFQFYKEINAKALAKRVGMNQTLLSQYVNGKKSPSEKQVKKILTGIRELGKELTELEMV